MKQTTGGTSHAGWRLHASFAALTAVLLVLVSIAYFTFSRLAEANRWNVHSYQVQNEIRSLTSSLFYLKRDARNFASTRNPKLVSVLKDDKSDLRTDFTQASDLTADSPEQQARLRHFNDLYLRWLDEYLNPLLMNQPEDKRQGKRDMDAMRGLLADLKQSEADLLDWRERRAEELQGRTALVLLAGGGLSIFLAVALSTLLAKSGRQLQNANQRLEGEVTHRAEAQTELIRVHEELQTAHGELDQRVRQRTAELETSREQLRALAAHVELVREEEKTRMAREIHDQLGQALTGLKMDTLWLNSHLPATGGSTIGVGLGAAVGSSVGLSDGSEVRRKIDGMAKLIDGTIQLVGEIASALRPAILDDIGLVAALEWQSEEFANRAGVACRFEAAVDDESITPEMAIGIFRIFQEALTNIARHAAATQVKICLEEQIEELVLTIADDGRGMEGGEWQDTKSLGLLGMNERAMLLRGTVSVTGAPGQGTTVELRVPLAPEEIRSEGDYHAA